MVLSNYFLILLIYYPSHCPVLILVFTYQLNYITDSVHILLYILIATIKSHFVNWTSNFSIHLPISVLLGISKNQTMMPLKGAIELVNWNFLFSNKSVHEQVVIFNQTSIKIFPNYIPIKIITVDEKDAQWMNESTKKKIMDKKYV